jgi:cytoplasmic FMR1 interacting protein
VTETLADLSDLSDLWMREFYLESTRRLQVPSSLSVCLSLSVSHHAHTQFPIAMSLPWILTDHVLETGDQPRLESVLLPFAIYDDAARRALDEFGQRFLYDEIEGEVNLCFDQLVFKLSEEIFRQYKEQAATCALWDFFFGGVSD